VKVTTQMTKYLELKTLGLIVEAVVVALTLKIKKMSVSRKMKMRINQRVFILK
jgi:hypothetical protein